MNKVVLCSTSDVSPGTVKRVELQGRAVAVYNIEGAFYATDDRCTHGLANLSDGLLDGDVIECAMHFGSFHVPSGAPAGLPCTMPLKTYPVEVQGSDVLIAMDEAAERS